MTKLPTIRSEKYSISIKAKNGSYKIFQIVFHTGSTSGNTYCLVGFPYFSDSKGLLSRLTFPANNRTVPSISLLPEGKTTSHLAKYTHPLDGNTHFSGDGKIVTSIRNKSKRLDISQGHMFTIQIQGIDKFELREGVKKLNEKRIDLDFEVEGKLPEAVKFVGRWFKVTDLRGTLNQTTPHQPKFAIREPDGTFKETGFVISPPENSPLSDFVMLISSQPIPKIDIEKDTVFSFIGGFDEVDDINKEMHFLACIYPATEYENLLNKIGSVDLDIASHNIEI